jgi:hypothetical protein
MASTESAVDARPMSPTGEESGSGHALTWRPLPRHVLHMVTPRCQLHHVLMSPLPGLWLAG